MNKNFKSTVILLAIIAAIFSFVVFIIPINHSGAVFWISYIAVLIAIALQIPVFKIAFYGQSKDDMVRSSRSDGIMSGVLPTASIRMNSKVYGFPIFRIGYIYLATQIFVSILFIIIAAINDDFPVWLCLLIHVLILGLALIGTVSADAARENIEGIEAAKRADVSFMNKLKLETESLTRKVNDPALAAAIKTFGENVRFSDPVSNEQVNPYNLQLQEAFIELAQAVENHNNQAAMELVQKAEDLLKDRNAAAKMYK